MRDLIWVRIFIAGLALFGESVLASDNSNSAIQDTSSLASLVADVSSHATDTDTDADSDNQSFITHLQLVNARLQHVDTCCMDGSANVPHQQRYFLPYPHAPPVKLI
jgi:hypothetical protein